MIWCKNGCFGTVINAQTSQRWGRVKTLPYKDKRQFTADTETYLDSLEFSEKIPQKPENWQFKNNENTENEGVNMENALKPQEGQMTT